MTFVLAPCVRCGHGADEHRIDPDALLPYVDVKFLCVHDGCSCPDYADEPLRRTKKLNAQT